jgi:hypothetical protein
MKKLLIAAAGLSVLAGCTTFKDMEKGLTGLVGMPAQAAFDRLGFPTAEERIAGQTVYVWANANSYTVPILTSHTTTGRVDRRPFTATTTTTEFLPINEHCTVRMIVDDHDIIRRWDFTGNIGGCENYGKRLKPVAWA